MSYILISTTVDFTDKTVKNQFLGTFKSLKSAQNRMAKLSHAETYDWNDGLNPEFEKTAYFSNITSKTVDISCDFESGWLTHYEIFENPD